MYCIPLSFLSLCVAFHPSLPSFSAITREMTKIWQKESTRLRSVGLHPSQRFGSEVAHHYKEEVGEKEPGAQCTSAALTHLIWQVCLFYAPNLQTAITTFHHTPQGLCVFHPPLPAQSTKATIQYFSTVAFHFPYIVSSTSGCLYQDNKLHKKNIFMRESNWLPPSSSFRFLPAHKSTCQPGINKIFSRLIVACCLETSLSLFPF